MTPRAPMGSLEAQRAAEDEEDLLRMQAELMAQRSRPAATVRRVGVAPPTARTGNTTSATAADSTGGAHATAAAARRAAAEAAAAPAPRRGTPQTPSASRPAPLEAATRVLGQVMERKPSGRAVGPPTRLPTEAGRGGEGGRVAGGFPVATHRSASRFSLARSKTSGAGNGPTVPATDATTHAASAGADPGAPQLAAMAPEEIAEARRELEGRLPARTIEFLRRRAREKEAAVHVGAAGCGEGTAPSRPVVDGAGEGTARATIAPAGASMPAGAPGTAASPPLPPPPPATPAQASSPASLVRFLPDGQVAGLAPRLAGLGLAARTVERDPLRHDAASEGWTAVEAAVASRSTVLAQRLAALRTLATVLRTARARLAAGAGDEPVPIPDGAASEEGGQAVGAPARRVGAIGPPGPTWTDLYRSTLADAEVAMVFRHALDDPGEAVASEAATALVALLGGSPDEELLAEAAAGTPSGCSPSPARRALARLPGRPTWCAARVRGPEPEMIVGPDGEPVEADPGPSPEEAARLDPLAGLLATDLGGRVAYLLCTSPRAVAPCLALADAIARAGPGAADELVASGSLARALASALDAPPSRGDPLGEAFAAARVPALRAARALVQSSPRAATRLAAAGGARWAVANAAGGADGPRALEALRLWRALARAGARIMTLDDAFIALGALQRPEEALRAGGGEAERAAEAFLLARDAVERETSSAACAAALLGAATSALASAPEVLESGSRPGVLLVAALAAYAAAAVVALPTLLDRAASAEAAERVREAATGVESEVEVGARRVMAPAGSRAPAARQAFEDALSGIAAVMKGSACAVALANWRRARKAGHGGFAADVRAFPMVSASVEALLRLGMLADTLCMAEPEGSPLARLATAKAAEMRSAIATDLCSGGTPGSCESRGLAAMPLIYNPWDAARDQVAAPSIRLLAWAADARRQARSESEALAIARASRDALACLAPGDERTALRLLSAALAPSEVDAARRAAKRGLSALAPAEARRLASPRVAAGAEATSEALLIAMAATWLGLEPERGAGAGVDELGGGEGGCAALPRADSEAVADPEGSRLPLPDGWVLASGQLAPPEHVSTVRTKHTLVAGALDLAAGWRAEGGGVLERDLAAASALVYLAPPDGRAHDPGVRAALSRLLWQEQAEHASASAGGLSRGEAEALVAGWAADADADDWLGGAAVLLALRAGVPTSAQIDALAALREGGGAALAALPPLRLAVPPLRAYLAEPTASGSPFGPVLTRAAREAYVDLLSDPAAGRGWRGGGEPTGAVHVALARLAAYTYGGPCDGGEPSPATARPPATPEELEAALTDPGSVPAPAGGIDRVATLTRLLARLAPSEGVAGEGPRRVLAALVRWDFDAGGVGGRPSKARAARVRASCSRDPSIDAGLVEELLEA